MEGIITLSRRAIAIYNRKRFRGITSEVASPLPAKHTAANTIKLPNKDICPWGQPSLAGLQRPHKWHSCHGEPLGGVSVPARTCNILSFYWLQAGVVLTGKFCFNNVFFFQWYFAFLWHLLIAVSVFGSCYATSPTKSYCSSVHSHFLSILSV